MSARKWPWPGDSPVSRARKVALAYRHLAQEQHQRAVHLREIMKQITRDQWALILDPDEADEAVKSLNEEYVDPTEALDRRFKDWGETWHAEEASSFEPDDYVSAQQGAKIIHLHWNTIHHMRARGRIKGVYTRGGPGKGYGGWKYKVADLYALAAQSRDRPRGWNFAKGTDSLGDSETGDSE